jgi:hypothetical protein
MANANDILVSVAYGHAFDKHQQEFNMPQYGSHDLQTKNDLLNLADSVTRSESSKAYINLQTKEVTVIDFERKIMMGLSNSRQSGDAGSIYPTADPKSKLQGLVSTAKRNSHVLIESRSPKDIPAMVEWFARHEDFSNNTLQKMDSPAYKTAAATLPPPPGSADLNRIYDQIETVKNANLIAEMERKAAERTTHDTNTQTARLVDSLKDSVKNGATVVSDGAGNLLVEGKDSTFTLKTLPFWMILDITSGSPHGARHGDYC